MGKCFLCQIIKLFWISLFNLEFKYYICEYLSKNRDMISTLSRTGCVLYFVNSRLDPDLDNHLQYVIFVRCYQHIDEAVVVVHDLRDSVKFALELMTLLS